MRHWAEELAREYLSARGYELLAENYPVRGGEIDLIMRHGEEIVFIEVRQRRNSDFGSPAESLDPRKLARLRRAARIYLARTFGRDDLPVRMDAVLVLGDRDDNRVEHLVGIG
ncbi:MAG TPA: YraN family protein [Trueperaceae bacterium]